MAKIVQFPRWAEVLADSSLEPKDREGFKVTIRWYLSWCARHSVGCSVSSARDFIGWAEAEKRPNAWMIEQWKSAIRWFKGRDSQAFEFACDPTQLIPIREGL